jgi:hypothetical protein
VFPEYGDCPVEPGIPFISIIWLLDKITFTYLFVSVILSNTQIMSRGIIAFNSFANPGDSAIVLKSVARPPTRSAFGHESVTLADK